MSYPENNENNRRELAVKYVSTWSEEALRDYVVREYMDNFFHDELDFVDTWDDFKDSFEWSEDLRESMKKDCPNPGCCCGACDKQDNEDWQTKEALNGRR